MTVFAYGDDMDLFEYSLSKQKKEKAPLADRMRPKSLEAFYGQQHIVGEGKILNRLIKADQIQSMIFYGPPGTGKTTLAKIISQTTRMVFEQISAVTSGVKEIRSVVEEAKNNLSMYQKRTIVFVDEIHRFNKSQQDSLLPFVEDGSIILIGATTENPFFEVNKALISRCRIMELKPLGDRDIFRILQAALENDKVLKNYKIKIDDQELKYLARVSSGDARTALNSLEIAILSTEEKEGVIYLDQDSLINSLTRPIAIYDKGSDEHYNVVSAFIKSMRGSDPDAAIYYLARMLNAGEEIKFIARRMLIFASEDIGNADPNALRVAVDVFSAVQIVGLPEARIILAQGVIYLATAKKSNSSYLAIDRALQFIRQNGTHDVPRHLKDSHYSGAKEFRHGEGYLYPHQFSNHYVDQTYLPEEIKEEVFYEPNDIGYEQSIIDYLHFIKGWKHDTD